MLSTPLSASLVAARYAKAAARPRCAIVRDKEIGIGAFECDHLERRIGLDLSHEIVKRIVHSIIDHIDRRIVQGYAPMARYGLVDDECPPPVAHSHLPIVDNLGRPTVL